MSENAQVTINGATFSEYECQISCAIHLWIKDANDEPPSDDTLGHIVQNLRRKLDKTALPCQNMVHQIQRHSEEGVRSIYTNVHLNQAHWKREASVVYDKWLEQNEPMIEIYGDDDLKPEFDTAFSKELFQFSDEGEKDLEPTFGTPLPKTFSEFSDESSTLCSSSDHRSRLSSKSSHNVTLLPVLNERNAVVNSPSSSPRDDGRSKTSDERYYKNSFLDSLDPQKRSLSCQTKDNDERYYRRSSYNSSQRSSYKSSHQNKLSNEQSVEQSLSSDQVSPANGQSDQSDTSNEVQLCSHECDPSTGGSTKSEDTDENYSVSTSDYDHLAVAYAKHQMMVTLMEEFYATFDPQWHANIRNYVTSSSRTSRSHGESSISQNSLTQDCSGKRTIRDREPSPDENNNGNNGKKRRSNPTDAEGNKSNLQFACPFYKYDPRKYCPNLDTGIKYRSCLSPGFASISKLKQHLKRTHSAPIQCQRCWLIMKNIEEMRSHVNADVRCEPGPIRADEGISQEKMDLISSKYGVSWEGIFKILFPGAAVPSPYHEPELAERSQPSSPQSNDLRSFEAYNRVALPLLVEASLRPAVNAKMEPMEEQLRTLIVDIVRSCQSTVAHNWELGNVSSADTRVSAQRASQDVYVTHVVEHETSESSTAIASNSNLDEFVKAPELADGGILPASAISHCQDDDLPQTSKTGYESLFDQNCQCPCHEASGLSSTLGGGFCESCTANHFDFEFSNLHDPIEFQSQ